MDNINETPPPGQVAGRSGKLGELELPQDTAPPEQTQQLTPQESRVLALAPTVDRATLALRGKLMTARDVAISRAADWHAWPPELQQVHGLVSWWAGRASLSPWPMEDLEKATDAARHLLTGTLILRRLGDKHGFV